MLTLNELRRIAGKEGVPQATIEKDYALSIALKLIAESKLSSKIVFKGGTAIKKVYFEKARFSEDLDFNAESLTKEEILESLSEIFTGKEFEGVKFEKIQEEKTRAGLKASLKFTGPLTQPQRIRFDFNFRQNSSNSPVKMKLIDTCNLGENEILVLSLEEIFAEKINALQTRIAPRDMYDAWLLFEQGVKLDEKLLEKKFSYYNEKFDLKEIENNIESIKIGWTRDLQQFINKTPDYEKTANYIKQKLEKELT